MIAVQTQENGNFAVKTTVTNMTPVALIIKTPMGWKVMTRNAGRKNSRTYSATPEIAAQKYYGKKIEFLYIGR